MSDDNNVVELCAVGDVWVNRDVPESIFELARPVLNGADIAFGNCECSYSDRPERSPGSRADVYSSSDNAKALTYAGFDIMTYANNHHLDGGYSAFFDTLETLRGMGIATCGAGNNLDEAREPTVVERKGTRVAFLGRSSILLPGYAAAENRPGAAPVAVHTQYEQIEMEQPGSMPRIHTFAEPTDVEALCEDVRKAKELADVVVFAPHWGLILTPAVLADYEGVVARAAIDAGADIVLASHQHIPKPIDVYKGKVIFHGMGNFAMDAYADRLTKSDAYKAIHANHPGYASKYDPEYPSYNFHPGCRRTMIARCEIVDKKIRQVSFLPCYINPNGQPEPLDHDDPRFVEHKAFMEDSNKAVGFDTVLQTKGNEVVVVV